MAQSKGILAAVILQQKALKCEFVRACMYLFIWDAICTAYRCTSLPRESFLLSTHRQYFELLTITNLKLCCVVQKSNTTTGAVQRMETQELSLSLISQNVMTLKAPPQADCSRPKARLIYRCIYYMNVVSTRDQLGLCCIPSVAGNLSAQVKRRRPTVFPKEEKDLRYW